ncbi:MAG: DUF3318 domain-containing protein [Okeania sp. SIO2C2]|uniref:DUF3318 domain-containing protein n=1 Tax=Okeania sp. SIO2C2 TaxID=2607787 RepID=UPI0013B92AEF|nr:DUF3318 domain-containing protein [Okeania sp. SIO2C2]NEP86651.1 DUF3318 domain-containing protein [Okeania sp. SIO2C2]
MNPELSETTRLLDIMPASGRMMTKIVGKNQQPKIIETTFPLPWKNDRIIYLNFDLWMTLPKEQRDLIMLQTVSWLCEIQWFKPNLNQGIFAVGLIGLISQLSEADVVGILVAGGLSTIGLIKIWQNNHSTQTELAADEMAIRVATRRGYQEAEAANYLLQGIENVAKIEGRNNLNFTELVRCQNLRAIAGLSPVAVPEKVRKE